jgi:hypothetical protein
MIDTNKYEGHTPAPWWMPSMELRGGSEPVVKMATFKREPSLADRILIADAPLLLAEVKRLRGAIADIANNMEAADESLAFIVVVLRKVIE